MLPNVELTLYANKSPVIPAPPATCNAPVVTLVAAVVLARVNAPDLIVPYVPLITLPLSVAVAKYSKLPVEFVRPKNALASAEPVQ